MMKKRLSKVKSQELLADSPLDSVECDRSVSPVSSTATSTGLMSKMKKVLGSYGSSPLERRRAQSLSTLNQGPTFGVTLDTLLGQTTSSPKTRKISLQHPSPGSSSNTAAATPSSLATHDQTGQQIPHIVSKIIEHIEAQGLRQEGIYRVNGNARVMEALKNSFDRTGDADLNDKDIFSVGGLLKLFLRELPISLIPEKQINELIEIHETTEGDDELRQLNRLLKKLPKNHFHLLQALCKHLLTLSHFSDDNKMTPVSLSIVFGPSVLRCGGGLVGLKKQGSANAAFTKMIQNYDIAFEDDSLLLDILPQQSPNSSFETRFRKVRRKPKKPEPYQKHMEQKTKAGARAVVTPKKDDDELGEQQKNDMDEAIDQAFEAVIREDIEANTKKQQHRKSEGWLATPIIIGGGGGGSIGKPKPLFHSDDLSTRVSSPYSWKSSTNSSGTSPTTSPAITPRSSQVLTTLIGDSIQDHLFETQTVTTTMSSSSSKHGGGGGAGGGTGSSLSVTVTSSTSSSSQQQKPIVVDGICNEGGKVRLATSNTSCDTMEHQSEEPSRVRQLQKELNLSSVVKRSSASRGSRYRKSAVYGATIVTNIDDTSDTCEEMVTNGGHTDNRTDKVSALTKELNDNKETVKNKEIGNRNGSVVAPPTSSTSANEPSSTGERIISNQIPEKDKQVLGEFDTVERTSKILDHPTLQRVRIPMKRAKPSRRSMILKKERELQDEQDGRQNINHIDTSTSTSSGTPLDNTQTKTTSSEQKPKPTRNVSVSSITSVTSKVSYLSTPRSSEPEIISGLSQTAPPTLMDTIVDTEEHEEKEGVTFRDENEGVAPEDQPGATKAWSKNNSITNDEYNTSRVGNTSEIKNMDEMSFEELLKLAQKVRSGIRDFENQFTKKQGRKPSISEQAPVIEQIRSLSTIKKKLKEIKTSENRTSKTAPVLQLQNNGADYYDDGLTSQSTANVDETPKPEKTVTVTRHKSLHAPSDRRPLATDLVTVCREMQVTLLERCAKAGRPHDLNIMTYEQLLEEKQVLQKLLLSFERKHGRPQTSEDKDVMRPVYNRYREVKRQLANYGSSKQKSSSNFASTEGVASPDEGDNTLGSVTILRTSLSQSISTTTDVSNGKPSLSSVGGAPSSFVLPISPERQSTSHKHITLKKRSSVATATTVSSLSSSVVSHKGILSNSMSSSTGGDLKFGHTMSKTISDSSVGVNHNSNGCNTNMELMETSTSELKIQLMLEQSRRKELRQELRKFEQEFELKHKRPLTKEDKKPKIGQYLEYRMVKSKISEISDTINSRRTSLHSTT